MRIENDVKLDFSDVLIRPKRSTLNSRSQVSLSRKFKYRNSGNVSILIPIMAANMDGVGSFEMAEKLASHHLFTCLTKHYPKHELRVWIDTIGCNISDYWAYSMGISDLDISKFDAVYEGLNSKHNIKNVCIDVANGYTESFVSFIKKFRDQYPHLNIIAGNVATPEMVEELLLSGVDVVKVGIGSGSVCTTRLKAGVGYPQLSAVMECADAAHGLGGHIISDGGIVHPADIGKAFGGGADFVMLGGMFAGHDEGGGEIIENNNQKFIQFYGMSSHEAMNKHYGEKANYRTSEGRLVKIPYKGPVNNTVEDILGSLRSTCTYVGATLLKDLSKCTTFVRVNNTHNRIFENNTIK